MNFRAMAFGEAIIYSDPAQYKKVVTPAEIVNFMKGSYLANGQWSVATPDSRLQREYEDTMVSLINAAINAYNNFHAGQPTLKNAQDVYYDLNTFKNYLQVKVQNVNGWTTPQAMDYIYTTYWGSYDQYNRVNKWLQDQASIALQELMDTATLTVGTAFSKVTSMKLDFYQNKIVPIANHFSQSDQNLIREVFVLNLEGETSLDDLLKAVSLVAPYLTSAELAPVMMFGPMMVLGNDLASNVLNTDYQDPYYARDIGKEIANITSKYRAVASRLGSYLDPSTESLFQQRLQIHQLGFQYPNDPRYSVCGSVCDKIISNLQFPITNELGKLFGLTKDGKSTTVDRSSSSAITENMKSVIANSVANDVKNMIDPGIMTPEMTAKLKEITDSASISSQSVASGSKSTAFPIILLLAAGYFLTKGRN